MREGWGQAESGRWWHKRMRVGAVGSRLLYIVFFSGLPEVRSRLYRRLRLRPWAHFSAFFEIDRSSPFNFWDYLEFDGIILQTFQLSFSNFGEFHRCSYKFDEICRSCLNSIISWNFMKITRRRMQFVSRREPVSTLKSYVLLSDKNPRRADGKAEDIG
jgi:hypothetical protein